MLASIRNPQPTARNRLPRSRLTRVGSSKVVGYSPRPVLRPMAAAKSSGVTSKEEGSEKMKEASKDDAKSDDYTADMQAKMGTTLTYNHELGINYNRILPDLIVGSCLQTAEDVDLLAEKEGVTTVFCLQENSDMEYFSLDIEPIQERCKERGDIQHVRFPIRDFDPFDLRLKLPKAVSTLAKAHEEAKGGTVYIHCTAGLGRAPATALAYMNWVLGMQLDEAEALLTGIRRCSPKIGSIRSATADLLLGVEPIDVVISLAKFGSCTDVRIAGLDFGWHQSMPLKLNTELSRFELHRPLLPGTYQYKFILDGHWTYSADHPTLQDGDNTNNVLEVVAPLDGKMADQQMRYMTKGAELTASDKEELKSLVLPWTKA